MVATILVRLKILYIKEASRMRQTKAQGNKKGTVKKKPALVEKQTSRKGDSRAKERAVLFTLHHFSMLLHGMCVIPSSPYLLISWSGVPLSPNVSFTATNSWRWASVPCKSQQSHRDHRSSYALQPVTTQPVLQNRPGIALRQVA